MIHYKLKKLLQTQKQIKINCIYIANQHKFKKILHKSSNHSTSSSILVILVTANAKILLTISASSDFGLAIIYKI